MITSCGIVEEKVTFMTLIDRRSDEKFDWMVKLAKSLTGMVKLAKV